jgi:heme/copper-type cytochrome/quinol oxidase subunit 2
MMMMMMMMMLMMMMMMMMMMMTIMMMISIFCIAFLRRCVNRDKKLTKEQLVESETVTERVSLGARTPIPHFVLAPNAQALAEFE